MLSRYRLDPEIAAVLAPMAAKAAEIPLIERGDWRALRERANANLALFALTSVRSVQNAQRPCIRCVQTVAANWWAVPVEPRPVAPSNMRLELTPPVSGSIAFVKTKARRRSSAAVR